MFHSRNEGLERGPGIQTSDGIINPEQAPMIRQCAAGSAVRLRGAGGARERGRERSEGTFAGVAGIAAAGDGGDHGSARRGRRVALRGMRGDTAVRSLTICSYIIHTSLFCTFGE